MSEIVPGLAEAIVFVFGTAILMALFGVVFVVLTFKISIFSLRKIYIFFVITSFTITFFLFLVNYPLKTLNWKDIENIFPLLLLPLIPFGILFGIIVFIFFLLKKDTKNLFHTLSILLLMYISAITATFISTH